MLFNFRHPRRAFVESLIVCSLLCPAALAYAGDGGATSAGSPALTRKGTVALAAFRGNLPDRNLAAVLSRLLKAQGLLLLENGRGVSDLGDVPCHGEPSCLKRLARAAGVTGVAELVLDEQNQLYFWMFAIKDPKSQAPGSVNPRSTHCTLAKPEKPNEPAPLAESCQSLLGSYAIVQAKFYKSEIGSTATSGSMSTTAVERPPSASDAPLPNENLVPVSEPPRDPNTASLPSPQAAGPTPADSVSVPPSNSTSMTSDAAAPSSAALVRTSTVAPLSINSRAFQAGTSLLAIGAATVALGGWLTEERGAPPPVGGCSFNGGPLSGPACAIPNWPGPTLLSIGLASVTAGTVLLVCWGKRWPHC